MRLVYRLEDATHVRIKADNAFGTDTKKGDVLDILTRQFGGFFVDGDWVFSLNSYRDYVDLLSDRAESSTVERTLEPDGRITPVDPAEFHGTDLIQAAGDNAFHDFFSATAESFQAIDTTPPRRQLVYIAGRYRGPTPQRVELNINAAEYMGWLVRELGAFPVIPHMNTRDWEELETPDPDTNSPGEDYYLEGTLSLALRCDAMLMVPGWRTSEGAIGELEAAKAEDIPVFYDIDSLEEWLVELELNEAA